MLDAVNKRVQKMLPQRMKEKHILWGLMTLMMVSLTVPATAQSGFTVISQFEDRYPRWSQDGNTLWFYSNRMGGADLFRIQADGTEMERITTDAGREVVPVPSPDGQWVVYTRQGLDDEDENLFLINLQTGEHQKLTDDPANDTDPNWSPDGEKVVFVSNRSGNYDVWEIGRDGTGLRQLTDSPQREGLPMYAPNGHFLVFQRTMARRDADIFVKDMQSGEETNVSAWDSGWDGWPSVRHDGEILFTSNRDGSSQLWAVQPDGSGLRQVTQFPGTNVRRAHWSPDGSRIVTNIERPQDPSVLIVVLERSVLLPEN